MFKRRGMVRLKGKMGPISHRPHSTQDPLCGRGEEFLAFISLRLSIQFFGFLLLPTFLFYLKTREGGWTGVFFSFFSVQYTPLSGVKVFSFIYNNRPDTRVSYSFFLLQLFILVYFPPLFLVPAIWIEVEWWHAPQSLLPLPPPLLSLSLSVSFFGFSHGQEYKIDREESNNQNSISFFSIFCPFYISFQTTLSNNPSSPVRPGLSWLVDRIWIFGIDLFSICVVWLRRQKKSTPKKQQQDNIQVSLV